MKTENNRINKKEIIIFGTIIVLLLIIIICLIIKPQKETSNNVVTSSKVQVYSKNTKEKIEWNNHDTIVVDPGDIEADLYSFDGGLNWQESNEYTITNNGRVNIIIRDKSGNKTSAVSYTINTIDNVAPVITVTLPSQIVLNQNIELKDYLSASDDLSGVDGDITLSPKNIDTSTLGTKIINCSIKDKAGNKTSINISVEVVEELTEDITQFENQSQPEEDKNSNSNESNNPNNSDNSSNTSTPVKYVTLYRYRVKKANSYTCKTYDCSYYSESDTKDKTKSYVDTGKCNASYNKTLTFNNGCYIIPTEMGISCTEAITKVERYSLYNDNYIDIYALLKDGSQFNNTNSSINSVNNKELTTGTLGNYKEAPCGENEISIYGYCHAICSTPAYTCPSGYKLVGGKCKKYISKTCSDTCTNYTWSDWSSWSETKVIASDEIQVETKTIKK